MECDKLLRTQTSTFTLVKSEPLSVRCSVNINIIYTNIIFVCRSGREGTSSVKGKQYGTVDDYAQEYEDLVSFLFPARFRV